MSKWISVILALALCSCQKSAAPQRGPVPVTAIKVVPATIPCNFEYVAVAESSHIVELRARVEGYLEKIAYEEGGLVHAGDLMFVLDQRPFIAQLDMAKGELAKEKAVLWNAQQSKNRMVPLYEANAVSQKDLDDAIAQELAADANVMTAQANVEKAALNLGFASLESPVTGMAGRSIFREGALISPGPNSLLTNIYVIDPIWVNFSVASGDILRAKAELLKGTLIFPPDSNFQIEIIMPDGSVLEAKGRVSFADPALQQSTGTMLVRSVLDNPDGWLRPGQFVRARVVGAIRPNAIFVPKTAVLQGQKGQFVYVINDKNEAEVRPIVPGDWYEDYWIITEGIKAGDVVIVQGVNKVQNKTPVEITTWVTTQESKTPPNHTLVYDIPLLH